MPERSARSEATPVSSRATTADPVGVPAAVRAVSQPIVARFHWSANPGSEGPAPESRSRSRTTEATRSSARRRSTTVEPAGTEMTCMRRGAIALTTVAPRERRIVDCSAPATSGEKVTMYCSGAAADGVAVSRTDASPTATASEEATRPDASASPATGAAAIAKPVAAAIATGPVEAEETVIVQRSGRSQAMPEMLPPVTVKSAAVTLAGSRADEAARVKRTLPPVTSAA